MKIGIAQTNPVVGDFEGNFLQMKTSIEQARTEGAQVVLFPELALCGYPPRDLIEVSGFLSKQNLFLEKLKACSSDKLALIVGHLDHAPLEVGPQAANAASVFWQQTCLGTYHKRLLPQYDVFDEQRHFQSGQKTLVVELFGKRVALTICEDLWNVKSGSELKYSQDIWALNKKEKPDLMVNLSASPYHLGKTEKRFQLFQKKVLETGVPLVLCNQVGGQDELLFDGASFAIDSLGQAVKLDRFCTQLKVIELNPKMQLEQTSSQEHWPTLPDAQLFEALVMGVRDYFHKTGHSQAVLGVSGGIDSAVAVVVLRHALGRENVRGLFMPSHYTSTQSEQDASALCGIHGVELRTLSIRSMMQEVSSLWQSTWGNSPQGLTLENIQPRLRMVLLMGVANDERRLLINTSNKSEIATGYSTLYGDSAGALAPLGDLLKTQVYSLAQFLNEKEIQIPPTILSRPPTAELRENQKDSDSLPDYALLDPLIEQMVVHLKGMEELGEMGFDPGHIQLVGRLYAASEYKRRQLGPVLRVSPKCFGVGRRVPLVQKSPWIS